MLTYSYFSFLDIPIQQQQPVNAPTQQDQQNGGNTERQETPAQESTPGQAPSTAEEQASPQPTTRLSVLKRGAFTFVASLWPNYGHDPRLAQAIQNEQQDEVSLCMQQLKLQVWY